MTLPRAEWITVTPEIANLWLDYAAPNRKVNPGRVSSYAAAMRRGDWPVTGETLIFDVDNRLVQGQHRCLAVSESGASIPFLCVFGVDHGAIRALDQGMKRTFAQQLSLDGTTNYTHVATATSVLNVWEQRRILSTSGVPNQNITELYAVLSRWPEVHEAVIDGRRVYDATRCSIGLASAARCIFGRVDEEDAAAFFDRLASGSQLSETDAIWHLRRILIADKRSHKSALVPTHVGALFVRAFNYWREGREVGQLKWRRGGARAEDFPALADYPEANA